MQSAVATAEYRPTEDEPFMNPRQREYFKRKLETWKEDILRESRETLRASRKRTRTIPTWPTAPRRKATGRWN